MLSVERLVALTRALVFFLTTQALLILLGVPLQIALGLPGHSAMEVLVFAGLPFAFAAWVEKRPSRPLLRLRMLNGKGMAKAVLLGAVGWFMAQLMGMLAALLLQQVGGEIPLPYDFLFEAPLWLALLSGALVPAICEELAFRGYIQGALRPIGPTLAVVLTGLLFGLMHMSLLRLVPLALLGMIWALAVQRSGSILPSMIGHLLNNGMAVSLAFFAQRHTNPADAQASLDALNAFPAMAIWVAIGMIGLLAAGAAVAAYFIAASFGPADLARPEAFGEEQAAAPAPERPVFASQEADVPEEIRLLQAELAELQQRRRRLRLQVASVAMGALSLAIFLLLASQEIMRAFP
jgi:membrane protease YdiL (CAAX protease family)